jgi:hypothetical protein
MFLEAMEYVLLFGGFGRLYEPRDLDTIMNDIRIVEDFFIAKDSGGIALGLPEEGN